MYIEKFGMSKSRLTKSTQSIIDAYKALGTSVIYSLMTCPSLPALYLTSTRPWYGCCLQGVQGSKDIRGYIVLSLNKTNIKFVTSSTLEAKKKIPGPKRSFNVTMLVQKLVKYLATVT